MRNARMDRRVQYTRMRLKESLLNLMCQAPIDKITVKDICQGADINRGTFYAHYASPQALLEQIEEELLERIMSSLQRTPQYSGLYASLVLITKAIQDNRELCQILLGDYGDKAFLQRIIQIVHDDCLDIWRREHPKIDAVSMEYLYTFFANGSLAAIRYWLQRDLAEPAEDIATFIQLLSVHALQALEDAGAVE